MIDLQQEYFNFVRDTHEEEHETFSYEQWIEHHMDVLNDQMDRSEEIDLEWMESVYSEYHRLNP